MRSRRCRWMAALFALGVAVPAGCTSDEVVDGGAVVGVEMAFRPSALTTEPGTVRFRFRNGGQAFHELAIERGGEALGRVSASPGEAADLQVELDPGTYEMTCREPGHYEAGMRGTLRVQDR